MGHRRNNYILIVIHVTLH